MGEKNIFKYIIRNLNKVKTVITIVMILALFFTILLYFIFVKPFYDNSEELGSAIGKTAGEMTGKAIGSYKGITKGIESGANDGKEAGLSAEDTLAEIKGYIENTAKLEVLVAGVSLTNFNSVGNKYYSLYVIKGNAVFTVDLEKTEIYLSKDEKDVFVRIPKPEMNLYIDEEETSKIAEYQKGKKTGSSEDGYKEYINSVKNTISKEKESINNYDSLMHQAEISSKKQIQSLVEAVCVNEKNIHVEFENEG